MINYVMQRRWGERGVNPRYLMLNMVVKKRCKGVKITKYALNNLPTAPVVPTNTIYENYSAIMCAQFTARECFNTGLKQCLDR